MYRISVQWRNALQTSGWQIPNFFKFYLTNCRIGHFPRTHDSTIKSRANMKVAIIGAGPAGLASLKHAIDDGHNCDVFEQTGSVGGTFVYTDYTDFDENGLPVQSAMYKGLTINLPKETMAFSDLPYPEQEKSFLGHEDVVEYYRNYTNHFNLQQYIQFYKCVTKVELAEETKWNVTVLDAKTKFEVTSTYDNVMVCNGHHNLTITPKIPGQDIFQGVQRHSHKYRYPEPYKDKIVLVIGSGPSGQDIGLQISSVAKHVFIVVSKEMFIEIPSNMTETSRVVRLLQNKAVFEDGKEEVIDVILYCTGYKYSVPFLVENSGVEVTEKHIFPVFKHIVNIEHPTMFFIGLPFIAILIPMLDIQARFAVAAIGKKFVLPSKEDMLKDFESEKAWRQENNIPEKLAHQLGDGELQRKYYTSLSALAGITNVPLVLTKIYDFHNSRGRNRNISYKIVDEENFEYHIMEAIVGAGSSGLIALKYAIDDGHSCDVFEQTGTIGGTFVYTDAIDVDENGFPVHTAMYKDLIVNLPKETMTFSDFPYPEQENSFIGQQEVLNYYINFAEHFNLKPHIQFYKYVKKIVLIEETKWIVTVQDLKTKTEVTLIYDAVFVCNGHYSSPITPEIPGQDIFQGLQLHCYKYRTPHQFKDKKVLVIGSGPSGPDISLHISPVAKDVFLVVSQKFCSELTSNIIRKPRVAKLCTNKAIFNDGTEEVVDAILYCTGYRYSIPFLGDSCGITVAEKQVFPLFKHMVNIEHPTMFFIGLFSLCSLTIPIWDLQARFALAALGKKFCLPSKEEMMKDFETENVWRQENGIHSHYLNSGDAQRAYFQYLSDLSGVQNLPVVLTKIFEFHIKNKANKRISYKILDNENFEHHIMKEKKNVC